MQQDILARLYAKRAKIASFRMGMAAAMLCACLPVTTFAEDILHIPRASHPPILADYIAGIPADAGVKISGFRQKTPGDGEPVSAETQAYLSYDDRHLYAVFVASDDPKLVRARLAHRDDIFGDDAVQLDLDTFHDKQRTFRFYVNPLGVQMDAKYTDGQDEDYNFDIPWDSEGKITDKGYVVVIAIPFKSLRFPREEMQHWGVSVGRVIARLNEFSYWPYITQRQAAFAPQMATAEIGDTVSPGRNIQFNPYVNLGRTHALNATDAAVPFWENQSNTRAGLDAKFVLADAFALDLTLHPDFSQVESDAPQVTIDKRYEVLFPEKRPFFLENAGFFQTAQPLFFSRRILDPGYGARITGREGEWSLGALLINDTAPGTLLPANDANYGKDAKILIARAQNDFSPGSNVGVMLTNRSLGNMSGQVAGVDTRYHWDDNWIFTGQLAGSRSGNAASPGKRGRLAYLEALRSDRNFNYSGKFLDISSDFDTTLGFLPRTDIRQSTQTASYLWNIADHPWLQSIGPQLIAIASKNHANELQDWSGDAAILANGIRGTSFEAHALKGYELYQGLNFHKQGLLLVANSSWFSWLDLALTAGRNEVINYTPATGLAPSLGDSRSWSASAVVRPFKQWRFEETVFWNDLRTQTNLAGNHAGTSVYRDLLSRTSLAYQHDRFLSGRVILDYDFLKTNTSLSGLQGGKRLNSDLQISYVLSPGTTMYAGYTDLQENVHLIGNPQVLQQTENLDLHTSRKIYLKFSYLYQL